MQKLRPPADALRSRRASGARRLRGLDVAVFGLLGLSCASVGPRSHELFTSCQETLRRGVFNAESLACFPQLMSPLEDLLCATTFTTHRDLNDLGFGYGTPVLGQNLGEGYGVDPLLAQRWKHGHCAGSPTRTVKETVDLRDRAFSLLPASLAGPWRSCREYFDVGPYTRLRCHLSGSYDLTGEGETVRFEAAHSPVGSMDFGTRLKEDLEVRGADCGGEAWRAGSGISSRGPRRLSCRRQGRSAVSFRLVTGRGHCEVRLPELTELPWEAHCEAP